MSIRVVLFQSDEERGIDIMTRPYREDPGGYEYRESGVSHVVYVSEQIPVVVESSLKGTYARGDSLLYFLHDTPTDKRLQIVKGTGELLHTLEYRQFETVKTGFFYGNTILLLRLEIRSCNDSST